MTANLGQRTFTDQNPQTGAYIDFYLQSVPEPEEQPAGQEGRRPGGSGAGPKVTITDRAGDVIRELTVQNPVAGVNRVVWDLRRDGLRRPAGGAPQGRRGGRGGPRVVPGTYPVSLRGEGLDLEGHVEVLGDPRHDFSAADYQAQATASGRLFEARKQAENLITRIEQTRTQLENLSGTLRAAKRRDGNSLPDGLDMARVEQDLETALKELGSFLVEDLRRPPPGMGYRQRPRLREELRSLFSAIDGAPGPPTQPQLLRLGELEKETTEAVEQLEQLMKDRVQPFNRQLKDLPAVIGE